MGMKQDLLEARWKQVRKELDYQWNKLSSDELDQIDGKRDNFVFLLERRYGFARTRAEKEVDLFVEEFEARLRKAS
jgi:uncharacterized protein YjbJ (UPF0337 family)